MTTDESQPSPSESPNSPDASVPPTIRRHSYSWMIPIITVVFVAVVVILGLFIQHTRIDPNTIPEPPENMPPPEQIYHQHCAMCHGAEGEGSSARYPPLVNTDWVVQDEERLILVTLYGLRGPIEVRDRTYDDIMPAFAHRLSDEEIALLLTYIRQSWGNQAPEITTEEVAAVRSEYPPPQPAWTMERLEEERSNSEL